MKNIFYILLLLPTIIFAQYPSNSGQKITLGEQTSADGLVYRGLAADTTRKPSVDTMAFILLDTNTNIIWQYKKAVNNAWTRLNLLPSDTTSFNYVNTYGAQTVNGAKTLTSNLILKNSQEPSRATIVTTQTFAADTTNWTRGAGWTFNGTQAVATAATGDLTYTPSLTITNGNAYEITYTVTGYSAGTLTARIGNASFSLPTHNATANVILLLPTSATGGFRFTTSTFTGNLDNVSVVEISNAAPILLSGQDDGSSTLYNSLIMPNTSTIAFGGGGARTTGLNNVFLGSSSGLENTTGNGNIFIGSLSGSKNTTGFYNAFFGLQSGQNNTIGSSNVFAGYRAGQFNTTGSNNFFFGIETGQNNTTGANNVFLATQSGKNNTIGSNNVFFGQSSGLENTVGSNNNFIGLNAGRSNKTGNFNIAIGNNSLYNTTVSDTLTGTGNVAIGANSADNIRFNANGNVAIGNGIDLPDPSGSNQVVIKNIIFATGASGTGTIIAGSVGIGTNAPTARLQVKGSGVTTGEAFKIENSGGTNLLTVLDNGSITTNSLTTNGIVYSNAGTLTNTNPSDSTLKNSINLYTYGLSEILQLKPKTFYYNLDVTRSHLKYGFIAQEVQPIMPDLVRIIGNGSDKLGLESEGIYVAMVNAIKELSAEINILKQEIINLKNK